MSMTSVVFFDGDHRGRARIGRNSHVHKPHMSPERVGPPVGIKLPRELVQNCEVGRLSGAFSLSDDMEEGTQGVIWCTGDDRKPTHAFAGIIERVSRHGLRKWALRVQGIFDLKEKLPSRI